MEKSPPVYVYRLGLFVFVVLLLALTFTPQPSPVEAQGTLYNVGLGNFTTALPAGQVAPQPTVYKTANVTGAMPTNDWWSSLAWKVYPNHSENMFAHPLAMQAVSGGLRVGYPKNLTITGDGRKYEYKFPGQEGLTIGVAGLNSAHTDVRVDGFSDWTVTADWSNGVMKATFGHGLPFVYVTKGSGNALVTFQSTPTIHSNSGGAVHATVNGQTYGIYGPTGSSWTLSGLQLSSSLAGKNYYSVAVLPDNTAATFNDYKQYAFAFITNTQVSWNYSPTSGNLTTTYNITTQAKEGTQTNTLMALYRHQWLNSSSVNTAYTYVSPRGQMKVVRGNSFTTTMRVPGVLPNLPNMGGFNTAQMNTFVNEAAANLNLAGPNGEQDTYWHGKALGRMAMVIPIADQIGNTAARDTLLNKVKDTLQKWYKSDDGQLGQFYYDRNWGTLIGYPANYGSQTELNDHHFHYGYYIMAAAVVGMYDPAWVQSNNWGGMTNLLIKDASNPSRAACSTTTVSSNPCFPFLRNFDPYAGHGWAAGAAPFAAGNNQESSSESTNYSAALILWGSITGDTAIRDLGVYLYTTEVNAIEQYWFDVDNTVLPNTGYSHNYVAMVWGDGGSYSTWWTDNVEEIVGINMLPITGGSLYLGRRPDFTQAHYNDFVRENGGAEAFWSDIFWQYLALTDAPTAISKFGSGAYTPEWGETKAHAYHWIHSLNGLGELDASVTGNLPTSAVFRKGTTKTCVGFNPTGAAITITFSDGGTLNVPARRVAASGCSGNPLPTATFTPVGPTATFTPIQPTATHTPNNPGGSNKLFVIDGGSLSFNAGGAAATDTVSSAGGANYDGTPHNPVTYTISGVTGSYNGGSTAFNLFLDAYASVGNGTQARISYDFTGDGSYDRLETYNYFPTDPVNGWENYAQTWGVKSTSGAFANLSNGRVRLEVWNAIGNGTTDLRTSATGAQGSQSAITIPFGVGTTPTATPTPDSQPQSNKLHVIDAGSLAFNAGGGATTDTIPSAGGGNYDGTPRSQITYTISGVSGTYNGGSTQFSLFLDAYTAVGNGTQARISYDFTGNGSYDRIETYNYFPTDPVNGWENYNQTRGIKSTSGAFANMSNGRVRLEVWSAIGNASTALRTSATNAQGSQSSITIPFSTITSASSLMPVSFERVQNGGFELGRGRSVSAWKGKNLHGDRMVCKNINQAYEGLCAFRFKGDTRGKSIISQKIVTSAAAGDILTVSAYVKASKYRGKGRIKAVITYASGATETLKIRINKGSYRYQLVSVSHVAADTVTKVQLRVQSRGGSGRFFIDNVSLITTSSTVSTQ